MEYFFSPNAPLAAEARVNKSSEKLTNEARTLVCQPEVVHELLELVGAAGQRHDDVDQDVARVHPLVFHLHQRPEGAEEDQAPELVAGLAPEGQLVQRPLVLLCAGDAWRGTHGDRSS